VCLSSDPIRFHGDLLILSDFYAILEPKGGMIVRSEEFIRLYKEMEDELERKYSGEKRRYSSVIYEYINDPESVPVRKNLDVCRELRNLLTHNAEIGGEPVAEPSEPVVASLRRILDYVRRPPLALDFATPGSKIISADPDDRVLDIMRVMEKNGYSHIPVLERRRFIGVFSVSTVFSCVLHDPSFKIAPETPLRALSGMLPLEKHMENYAFVHRETSITQARQMFEKPRGKNKRLSVIFITEHGRREEGLLGMLTPWDIMKEE